MRKFNDHYVIKLIDLGTKLPVESLRAVSLSNLRTMIHLLQKDEQRKTHSEKHVEVPLDSGETVISPAATAKIKRIYNRLTCVLPRL